MMVRSIRGGAALVALLFALSCASYQAATYKVGLKSYEPKSVAVLPTVVGSFTKAAGVVEEQVSVELQAWGIKVVDPETIKEVNRAELLRIVDNVQTQGEASPAACAALGKKMGVDTFVVTEVTAWSHRADGEEKFAVVEVVFRLVEAATGKIVWRYTEGREKEYWVIAPELKELSKEVLAEIIKLMPKGEE